MNKKNKLILIFFSIFALCITNIFIIKTYRNYLNETLNHIVSQLIEKYPDEENNIINALLENENNNAILKEYGININTLNEISAIKKVEQEVVLIIGISFSSIFLLFLALIFLKDRKIKKDIASINLTLNEILKGKYDFNMASYNEDELSVLKNDIYKVTIKLKELSLYEQKEQAYLVTTLEDISHQLKTPLTALLLTNDILKNKDLTEQERKDFLNKQSKELEKMEWLITTLLNMSKLSSGMVKLKQEQINCKDLIEDSLESLTIPLELKDIEIILENLDFTISCDISWTKEAITNILKNAYEHTNEFGCITITGINNPLYKAIYIKDNGCGISKEDIKNIFKRFYSTSKNSNSIGIGLNMAKLILEKQNAKIEVESELHKYTIFKIIFSK